MIETFILRVASYAVLGALIGAAYFAALEWNVRLYAGRGAAWDTLLIHLTRLGFVAAAFTLCARQGAAPLLASFAGFMVMRTFAVNRYRLALERNQ